MRIATKEGAEKVHKRREKRWLKEAKFRRKEQGRSEVGDREGRWKSRRGWAE